MTSVCYNNTIPAHHTKMADNQATRDGDEDEDTENTLKLLVATDCHIGYMDKDAERCNDSLETFEEILQHAKNNKVDMILLGGDLFHENKPSRKSLHGLMALIRQYCMGDQPIQIEFLSDQCVNFAASKFPHVNYEDQNLNISIPIFSIHGNHDDPAGLGNLCVLDILSVAGLVNYFGKAPSLESVEISPILLQKGRTKLALYGLGSIRDERLHRMFRDKKVSMLRPREDKDLWFNVLVFHQNRSKHGETNYIPEQFLDNFLDLVIWGHEHECKIDPCWNPERKFFVSQPGSSIATSLSEGESKEKHVCLLEIRDKAMKCTKIKLETVRQFYLEEICLSQTSLDPADNADKLKAYCEERVEALIDRAADEHTGHPKQPKKPLIRLKIDYSGGYEVINITRFGQKYVERVANPKDILAFHRRKMQLNTMGKVTKAELDKFLKPEGLDTSRVEDLVKKYFQDADEKNQLSILSEKGLGKAVQEFVDKEEKEAIPELVGYQLEKTQGYLRKRQTNEESIEDEIQHFKTERQKMSKEEVLEEVSQVMKKVQNDRAARGEELQGFSDENSGSESEKVSKRGRGRGRGARGGRASRGGRGARASTSTRGSSRGRGQKGVVSSGGSVLDAFNASKTKVRAGTIQFEDSGSEEETRLSARKGRANNREVPILISDSEDDDDHFSMQRTTKKRKR
ncbi:double-strand break repair protein MRE11-like isoform X2 [Anneissia japonica]|uniref:double-strand break repair protein MRE11-like isoform X2 n=1 Tax=Anneissia japonica TaxID=1529436 RepID=UPI001425BA93|nr:double-strand break repair protein MRE11-like isoform X2 [Anneissia japonica]